VVCANKGIKKHSGVVGVVNLMFGHIRKLENARRKEKN
jgi:hypothetical protein